MNLTLDIFTSLAEFNEAFISLSKEFSKKNLSRTVRHNFNIRPINNGCLIEIYFEQDRDEDKSFCWWFELKIIYSGWVIEIVILKNDSERQEVFQKFPIRSGETLADLPAEITNSSNKLIESIQTNIRDGNV